MTTAFDGTARHHSAARSRNAASLQAERAVVFAPRHHAASEAWASNPRLSVRVDDHANDERTEVLAFANH